MDCAESLRVQAYFDGELDPASTAQIERHVGTCALCQSQLQDLGQFRDLLRSPQARVGIPPVLRSRIMMALEQEAPARVHKVDRPVVAQARPRLFWFGVLSGIAGSAIAAALGFLYLAPLFNNPLPGELVADHTRSLMAPHLIDVVSTDQHTVKPWFAGRVEVSPEVADFAPQGYRLLGGRVDDLAHHRVAVVVYQHGPHYINVFSWAVRSGGVPADATRNGYHLIFWKAGDLGYCAVSDTGWTELQGLARLIQDKSARDTPP